MNTRALSIVILLALSCAGEPEGMTPAASDTTAPASGTSPEPTAGLDTTAGMNTAASMNTTTEGSTTSPGTGTGLPDTGSTGFLTTGEPTGGPGMAGVYARWEVRDNTGTPVEVWASPNCHPGDDCQPSDFGPINYDCMAIAYMGQDRIGVTYDLATGDPAPCYQDYPSWSDNPAVYYYFDAACTQPALFVASVYMASGTLYYGSYDQSVTPGMLYTQFFGGMCSAMPSAFAGRVSAPVPVPASILGLMSDAPYEIGIAY